jgi:serine/threonine protein kinase/WD40 repeat protein
MIGKTVSHYRITEKLGQGGMGEVFLAHDTMLDRKVALKFLPDVFSGDPERLARFEREAKLLASLNHPNIAAIHGLEAANGKRFLVLEYVDGETLAQKLDRGPLPVDESLEICRQIAEGVEAAHEKGIIHRDLKPANVKITPEGKVKVLDFGLAKAFSEEPSAADLSRSPTLTDQMTRPGVILGTAAYMSPEQAKGKAVDKRSDIWAFGCILYECLTGRQPFQGDTVTETLAAVIKAEPDWRMLPADTPFGVRTALRRCLQKDTGIRLRDIADARIEILDAASGTSGIQETAAPETSRWRALLWTIASAMMIMAIVFVIRSLMLPMPASPKAMHLTIPLPAPLFGQSFDEISLAISSDGLQIAYVAGSPPNTLLYWLRLDDPNREFKQIKGLKGVLNPFFSPDGSRIAFFKDGALQRVPLSGGPVETLITSIGTYPRDGIYENDKSILFTDLRKGIYRLSVPADHPKLLMSPDVQKDENHFKFPQRLPGGDRILFTFYPPKIESANDAQIAVRSVDENAARTNITQGTYARYLPTGHLVYGYNGKLMAVPFDPATLKPTGSGVEVLDGVLMTPFSGKVEFAVSNTGHLVYVPGTMVTGADTFVLLDRNGNAQLIEIPRSDSESHFFVGFGLSSDGRRIAVALAKANNDIHTYHLAGGPLERATFEPSDEQCPVWHPDGSRLAYTWEPAAKYQMRLKNLNSKDEAISIFDSENPRYPSCFHPSGDILAFVEKSNQTGWDILIGSIGKNDPPKAFLKTGSDELFPAFSPDGQWIAYQSDKSGQPQVYVAKYPEGIGEQQVSLEGGTEPRWDPQGSGNELFYRGAKGLHVAEVVLKLPVQVHGHILLFSESPNIAARYSPFASYAVMPGGKQFVFINRPQVNPITQLCFVVNWFEELKQLCPIRRK